jgi:hypothetical protein
MNIAFDVDDTIYQVYKTGPNSYRQVPDYDLILLLRWFAWNGDKVFVWSAGGVDYAQQVVDKLGLTRLVRVIPKEKNPDIDIAFDDAETGLAKVDIRVKR